ncbi:hypothetical protein SGRIM119S_07544 [Streptomyces griseorubiginosus]
MATAFRRREQQLIEIAGNRTSTSTVSATVPPSSSTALTIWIQVVARIPPRDT